MGFDAVLGQDNAKRLIRAAFENGRLGHAYLFAGPDGVGKTLFALETAKLLFCRGGAERPCGECSDCRRVDHGRHPDLLLVAAAEGKRIIGIKQAREIGQYLALKPVEAERRVVIVREAERLSDEAANSLLKTLEEPSSFGFLILTASRPRSLPDTVQSRCQRIPFSPLSAEHVETILSRRLDLESGAIRFASRFAEGSAGNALRTLELECVPTFGETMAALLDLPSGEPLALADVLHDWARAASKTLEPQRERLREMLRLIACCYRDALLAAAGGEAKEMFHADAAPRLAALGRRLGRSRLLRIFDALWDARRDTDANVAIGLVLDNLFTRIAELQAA